MQRSFFFFLTHLQDKNIFNGNLSVCLHLEVELTVYCLFCSVFLLVHFVSLARDVSHLEQASCTVVKWAKLHRILRAQKRRRKMQHFCANLLVLRAQLHLSSTGFPIALPSSRLKHQNRVRKSYMQWVQLLIRTALAWLKIKSSK